MAADENILKSFLYEIGAKLDEPSIRKAGESLEKLSKNILAIGASIEGLALTLAAVTIKMADSFEKMYWSSQRTGATVQNMRAFEYATGQLGGTVEGAHAALENFASFMRRTPLAANWIKTNFGVSNTDAGGKLKDQAQYLQQILEVTGKMYNAGGAQRAKALSLSSFLGIDEDTLRAVNNPEFRGFIAKYAQDVAKSGINMEKAAKNSKDFMQQVRELGNVVDDLKIKVFSDLEEKFGKKLVDFTEYLRQHLPEIAAQIERIIDKIIYLEGRLEALVAAMGGWKTVSEELLGLWLGGKALGAIANVLRFVSAFGGASAVAGGAGAAATAAGAGTGAAVALAAGGALLTAGGLAYGLSKFGGRPGAADHPGMKWQSTGHSGYWVPDPNWHATPDMVTTGRSRASAGQQVPRGLRNNNPGNIRFGKFAQSMGATGQDDRGFAVFPNLSAGVSAASSLLGKYLAGGTNSVSSIISKWAPSSENNTPAYVDYVSRRLGVGSNDTLTPAQVQKLQSSIFSMEVGAENWSKASLGLDASSHSQHTTINNDIDVNVSGADPQANGAAVVSSIRPYAAQLRNTKGVVY